jgi:site-specific DNA recombinase
MARQLSKSLGMAGARLRCAIYTRKSTEEGLEQDFNSLDAQRDACEAFVVSQKHEGWIALAELYDDGGFSGATMERPAFQRLLADVRAGKIDIVVVYKVDRLTRSLSDFAKIVEVFDQRQVSFVSVTQQFNTTSSMGRLTLNILLSFAQFEREVTGERIRDKIAASKRKGMWMGGLPSLGYDVREKRLIVNEHEAKTVRYIFRRYTELRSVRLLQADLGAQGIVSKPRQAADGSRYGEKPLARGALYLMLQNRIYRGEIVHKGKSYPGHHEAIVDEALWSEVQSILQENRTDRIVGTSEREVSLLSGILFDARGERLTPTYSVKNGIRYRYYVSRSLVTGSAKGPGQRIPALELEALVRRRVHDWLADRPTMLDIIQNHASDNGLRQQLIAGWERAIASWPELGVAELRTFVVSVISRIQAYADRLEIVLDPIKALQWSARADERAIMSGPAVVHRSSLTLTVPMDLRRIGKEMRIIVDDATSARSPDSSLIRVLVRGHAIRTRLLADKSLTLEEIAKSEGITPSYATRLFRLTLLAPDVLRAILNGEQPPDLTARKLMDDTRLPLEWNGQRWHLGFA